VGYFVFRISFLTELNFSRFRVVTFDCYGTLINWETGILNAIRPVLSAHNANLSDADILGLYSELEAEAESSLYSPYRDVLRSVVRGVGSRLGFQTTDAQQQSLPESLANWTPFRDTVAALHRLKAKFKLGIISNVDDDLFATTARRLEIDFDYVITAGQARAYKPSLKIFELAQQRIGVQPEQWLHAAQSVYHDVIPAKSLGISTVWVNRPSLRAGIGAVRQASAEADVTVTSMQALADLAA
jgi:2-haloacid dehalogenase